MIVTERLDTLPFNEEIVSIKREEKLLLDIPDAGPRQLWHECEPLGVINMPMHYIAAEFSTPKAVFENDQIHIEWQQLNGRQPFYHRNQDCDEIAYHVCGERTILTEFGTVDLEVGDFTRIPLGVCHDNRAMEDVHLLFYIPSPVKECKDHHRIAEFREQPFEGWKSQNVIEFITEHLGAMGSETSIFRTDEAMLLAKARESNEYLRVLRAESVEQTEWLYKGPQTWLGCVSLTRQPEYTAYTRHLQALEIQIQVAGRRTLLSQRGTVDLEPGDFVCIPKGCAFNNVYRGGKSTHIVILGTKPPVAKRSFAKFSVLATPESGSS